MNEKLEKLNRELAKGEARLRRAQHEEKILEHQMKQLTRKERTHRLCTRGAALESYLPHPELVTDEQVGMILKQKCSHSSAGFGGYLFRDTDICRRRHKLGTVGACF